MLLQHAHESSSSSPIETVVKLLEDMKRKSLELSIKAKQTHTEIQNACKQEIGSQQTQIETSKVELASLQSRIDTAKVDVEALQVEILQHQQDFNALSQQLESEQVSSEHEAVSFRTAITDLDLAIRSVERVLQMLRSQGTKLLQHEVSKSNGMRISTVSDIQALSSELRIARNLVKKYQPDTGGMSKDEHIFDEFNDLSTSAGGYTSQAGSVVTLLQRLKDLFHQQRQTAMATEVSRRNTSQSGQVVLGQQIASIEAALNSKKEVLAGKQGDLAMRQQSLDETSTQYKAAIAYLSKVEVSCSKKQQDYVKMQGLRESEHSALTKAISTLKDAVTLLLSTSGTAHPYARTMSNMSSIGARQPSSHARIVVEFIRKEALRMKSFSLDELVNQAGTILKQVLEEPEPFVKVKQMIRELIARLQQSTAKEASHKAWCDTQLAKVEAAQQDSEADVMQGTAKAQQLQGSIAKLAQDVLDMNTTLERENLTWSEQVSMRRNESISNEEAIAQAQNFSQTLSTAIRTLEGYYTNVSRSLQLVGVHAQRSYQAHKYQHLHFAPSPVFDNATGEINVAPVEGPLLGETQGVVGLLKMLRDDYSQQANSLRQQETSATHAHTELKLKHNLLVTTTGRELSYGLMQYQSSLAELLETKRDLNESHQAVADAAAAYENLRQPCLSVETYEERKAKREEEINALQEASAMLEQYATEFSEGARSPAAALQMHANSVVLGGSPNTTSDKHIQEVVRLLQTIFAEVASDLASDRQAHHSMTTWCASTISQVQEVILQAFDRSEQLGTEIEISAQEKARLTALISQQKAETERERAALEQLSAMRRNQREKFHQREKELLESISALSHAVTVLSRHYHQKGPGRNLTAEREQISGQSDLSGSSPFPGSSALVSVAAEIQEVLRSINQDKLSIEFLNGEAKDVLERFVAQPQLLLVQQITPLYLMAQAQTKHVDGHVVYGILQELKSSFQSDLAAARQAEAKHQEDFVGILSSKEAQVAALQASVANQKQQLAQQASRNANANEDRELLKNSRQADQQYLYSLHEQCTNSANEFKVRNSTRVDELDALSRAITLLSANVNGTSSADSIQMYSGLMGAGGERREQLEQQPAMPLLLRRSAGPRRIFKHSQFSSSGQPTHKLVLQANKAFLTPKQKDDVNARARFHHQVSLGSDQSEMSLKTIAAVALHTKILHKLDPMVSDAIANVVRNIDKVRNAILEDQQKEVRMRDTCIREGNQAQQQLERRSSDQTKYSSMIQRLSSLKNSTDSNMADMEKEINELVQAIQGEHAQRAAQFQTFKATVRRQQTYEVKLQGAIQTLRAFYNLNIRAIDDVVYHRKTWAGPPHKCHAPES